MNKPIRFILTAALVATLLTACQSEATEPEQEIVNTNKVAHKAEIIVYKSASCSCCKDWGTYLEEEGFKVTAIDHDDIDSIKTRYGLTDPSLKSCHSAIVDGYLIEGHVPASDIERLLSEKPTNIKGLTAPGMPMNSPGMASRIPKDYAVLSYTGEGETEIYSQY